MAQVGRYRAYPAYKPSGVEWSAEFPETWAVTRFKNLFSIKKRIAGGLGHDVLSITQKGIKIKDLESGEGQLAMDYSKYQRVYAGDFAMNHMDLLTGYVDVSKYDGVTSPDYRVFSLEKGECHPAFYLYILQHCYHAKIFFPLGRGAAHLGRWRLPTEAFNTFVAPNPTKFEQSQIAAFLDYETAKIDALIAKQKRLIALLEEKRQAVISHAVTKGLDPTAPLRPSGIDWLGDVPAHWEVMKLKRVVSVRGGYAFSSESFIEVGKKVIRIGDIDTRGNVSLEGAKCVPVTMASQFDAYEVRAGQILMAMTGATIGKAGWFLSEEPALLNQRVGAFVCDGSQIASRYFWYVLKSEGYQKYVTLTAFGGAQPNISDAQMLNYSFARPDQSQQSEIVAYLDRNDRSFDLLSDKAKSAIILLKERRTALISAAVTGKIDVRDWQAPSAIPTQDISQDA